MRPRFMRMLYIEYEPSRTEMARSWRKGSFLRPFCHLLDTAIRHELPPFDDQKMPLRKLRGALQKSSME